jgi:hypothetical protein
MPNYLGRVRQEFAEPEPSPYASNDNLSTGQLLAIIVPIASVLSSISWAIATYLIVREKTIAKLELARLEYELKAYEYLALEDDDNTNKQKE